MLKFDNSYICILPENVVEKWPDPWNPSGKIKDEFYQWMKQNIPKHKFSHVMSSVLLEIEDIEADRALLKLTWNVY